MRYKYILFDLDGTLTDPQIGITKSVKHALQKKDIKVGSLDELNRFIGPPLIDSFMEFYLFNEIEAKQAVEDYREYFKETGIFENEVYDGISDILKMLKSRGAIIAVATSKPTIFAKRIIEFFGLIEYFDIIVGSNLDGTRSNKSEVIDYVLEELKIDNLDEVIMVGDRMYDVIGAQKSNVDCIGVAYGYGSLEELQEAKATYIVKSVDELEELLARMTCYK